MKHFVSLLLSIVAVGMVNAQSLDGEWSGRLDLGGGRGLKLVLHIDESAGAISMDSPDQGAFGLECKTIYMKGDSVNLQIPNLMMSYSGRVSDDVLSGTFQQGGLKLPLAFEKVVKKKNRPQTPQPPFPYSTDEVKIYNSDGSVVLAGTLTMPSDLSKSTPIVVLVSGSGAQNRDEELFEHKPFAVIADYLARNGIASLRYDDRGFGESTGDRSNATTADYASDTRCVVDWVRRQNKFGKIGVIGHSEGGIIAYMLGASDDEVDFVVSIAGPVVAGSKILDYQNKLALMNNGMSESLAEEYAVAARQQLESDPTQIWMQYFLRHDPAKDVKELKVPAFIIYGEKDSQVPPSLNFEEAKLLAPKAMVKCYPNLNHLMQHANTGWIGEYGEIEETFAEEVLSDIAAFIKDLN